MIAVNGHKLDIIDRLVELEQDRQSKLKNREAGSAYRAGQSGRMNPVPRGIDPYGTDADYHYRTSYNYYLMVERARDAVRNHPLVEQGINRLIANLKLGEFSLDVDSGDKDLDRDHKQWWRGWCSETQAGQNLCDYEGSRSFAQISRQSFFSQVQDGDTLHVPLREGSLQTWEAHHLRSPWGHRPTGLATEGIVHGVEIHGGRVTHYHVTPLSLTYGQSLVRRSQSMRVPAFDESGNRIAFWLGFRHRFYQRRGISRLASPQESMNGFDDLNYANIKSSLRRAIISYLMEQSAEQARNTLGNKGGLPQSGDRYSTEIGLGLQSMIVEQQGEPAQVFKTPPGWQMKGWNANLPSEAFFEHSALLLTMLSVNLDLPLMFLLLDGSLVNFHGGRMTFDQCKLRFKQIQQDQIQGLWQPVYEWKTRQRITPGSPQFDPQAYAAVQKGANLFNYKFRPAAWPYVKPLEDITADRLAESSNLKTLPQILNERGIDFDDHQEEQISSRGSWIRRSIQEAKAIQSEYSDCVSEEEIPRLWREVAYGKDQGGVQLTVAADAPSEASTKQGGERVEQ